MTAKIAFQASASPKAAVPKPQAKNLAKARSRLKKRKPKFKRQEGFRCKKLKKTWRRAKGRHSKMRARERGKGKMPGIGYRSPSSVRGVTSSGYRKVVVHNVSDIKKIDPKTEAAVIAHDVGKRKRAEILETATQMKIAVSNVRKLV